mmetsp:Transcript_132806/g.331328  ORF Transcript_132806/g.331328 Transcript_132806/m.331328 type:complete len:192 (-) Transcript_132806:6-581(-)
MDDLPTIDRPTCRKSSSGRRLSWADQAPPLSARPIADEIPLPVEDVDVADRPGEVTLNLGILRQGNTYGVTGALPDGITSAEVLTPLPDGMVVQVKADDGVLSLWVETTVMVEGRLRSSFVVSLQGTELPELAVHVEANIMGPRDGRPSRTHDGVVLLNCIDKEVFAMSSEGSEWKRVASQVGDDDDDANP